MQLITQTSRHYLRLGCELLLDEMHVIVAAETDDSVSLKCFVNGEQRTFTFPDLDNYFKVGRLVPRLGSDVPDAHILNAIERQSLIATCSVKAQKRLLELKSWLNALKGLGIFNLTPNDMLKQHMKSLLVTHLPKLTHISMWTLYRNEKKLRDAGGDNKALIPNYHQRGKTITRILNPETGEVVVQPDIRLPPEVAEVVNWSIEDTCQNEKKLIRTFEVFRKVKTEIERINQCKVDGPPLLLPSKMTVSRWINREFTSHEMAVRRIGKKGADKLFRMTGARMQAERILECSQHDDIDTRVFLIDEETGRPWGTAYMTFCVDEYSRAVLGCTFGVEHRSIESALATVFHGIRRKDMSGPEYKYCTKPWVMHGLPGIALLDNASYNAAQAFHLTLMDLGMDYAFARPHTPTDKSAVEFFNGQFKHKFAASLPGASIKKGDRDASARGMKTAELTLTELNAKSMQWIVDEYLNERTDSGFSPMEKWMEQADMVDLRVPDLKSTEFLKHSMVESLKLRDSGGLLRNKLRYQNDEIEELQRRVGLKTSLDVRVNPNCLASLYVRDPQAEKWFQVPCIEDMSYVQGLTDSQHKLIVKAARERKMGNTQGVNWALKTKDQLLEDANKLSKANDLTSRGVGYRIRNTFKQAGQSVPTASTKPKGKYQLPQGTMKNDITAPQITPLNVSQAPAQTKQHPDYLRMLEIAKTFNT